MERGKLYDDVVVGGEEERGERRRKEEERGGGGKTRIESESESAVQNRRSDSESN